MARTWIGINLGSGGLLTTQPGDVLDPHPMPVIACLGGGRSRG